MIACRFIAAALIGYLILLPTPNGKLDAATMAPWTQFEGNAAHTGYVPGVIANPSNSPIWTVTPGEIGVSAFTIGAATDATQVYVSGSSRGSETATAALNITTGAVQWTKSISFSPGIQEAFSPPSVANGIVYVDQYGEVTNGYPNSGANVYGLNTGNGSVGFETGYSAQLNSGSRPTPSGSQVFVAGGFYGGLNSFDAQTGENQWFATVNQQYGWIPAADSSNVYLYLGSASASPGPQNGTLFVYNRSTGALAYSIEDPNDHQTLNDGTVALGSQNDAITLVEGPLGLVLTSFNLATKSTSWMDSANWSFNFGMAIRNGLVYADHNSTLAVLNEATGATVGSWSAPAGQSLTGDLLVTDNLIFAQTTGGTFAIDETSLETVWSTSLIGDLSLGSGVLLIQNQNDLYAFSVASVPEPSTLVLAALGGIVAAAFARRRRAA